MRRCHVDAAEVLADVHGLVRFVGIINAGQPLQGDQPQIRTWLDEREHPARRPPEVEVVPRIGLRRPHALLLLGGDPARARPHRLVHALG